MKQWILCKINNLKFCARKSEINFKNIEDTIISMGLYSTFHPELLSKLFFLEKEFKI